MAEARRSDPGRTWYQDTVVLADPPRLEDDIQVDVVLIGGGFTGMGAALELLRQGASVAVLEASGLGEGASGRNGGQVHVGLRQDPQSLTPRIGTDAARASWDLGQDALRHLHETLIRSMDIDCDYRPGVFHAWHRPRFAALDHAYAEHMSRTYGYQGLCFLDRAATAEALGTDVYLGGMLDQGGGHLNPLKLLDGMARAAATQGAHIYTHSPASRPVRRGSDWVVATPNGEVRAGTVLLCGNGLMNGLDPDIDRHVLPLRNYILTTEPLGETDILRAGFAVADSRHVVNYFRRTPDGRLLFGGGEGPASSMPDDIATFVHQNLSKVYPRLGPVALSHAWGGTLGVTVSRLPFVRQLGPGLWTASGFSGQGVCLAPYVGQLLGRAVLKGDEGIALLSGLPVPPFPGGPWLRPAILWAGLSYYALLDRL